MITVILRASLVDSLEISVTYILPMEWRPKPEESHYQKMLKVTDYISGLTDLQAALLFQQFRGISLGS